MAALAVSAFAAPRSAAWHVFQGLSPERMALPISDTIEAISESVERALKWGHASRLRRDRCLHPRSVQPAVAVACPWTLQRGLGIDRAWLWTSQYATKSDACWAQARSAALGLYGGARRLSQISLTRPHGRGSPCRAYTLTQYEGAAIGSVQAAQHVCPRACASARVCRRRRRLRWARGCRTRFRARRWGRA